MIYETPDPDKADEAGMQRKKISEADAAKRLKLKSITIILDDKVLGKGKPGFLGTLGLWTKTLAHEFGHAMFDITQTVKAWLWNKLEMISGTEGYSPGHTPWNPSGAAAKQAETPFK